MTCRSAALALLLLSPAVWATDWESTAPSALRFEGTAQGESFIGEFKRFTAKVSFDPSDLAATRFDVAIDLASADSQNAERDELLQGGEFFDVGNQSQARFEASGAEAQDQGYLSRGTLTLKGNTRAVNFRFRFTSGENEASLDGEALLDRTDFAIGAGDWEDAEMIDHSVKVITSLSLQPVPATPGGG
jgi:polyisoprenoid-binding protein YceI